MASNQVLPDQRSNFAEALGPPPDKYPGESIENAGELRKMLKIPPEEEVSLSRGTIWCRQYGELTADKTPIVIISGRTGNGMYYKDFAERLAGIYGSAVFIFDRFGIGLSDRVFPGNGPKLWCASLDELLKKKSISKTHFLCFSMGGAWVRNFMRDYPGRAESIGMVAPIIVKPNMGGKAKGSGIILNLTPNCGCRIRLSRWIFLRGFGPYVENRCYHQVEEGAALDGWKVAKHQYRVKKTGDAFMEEGITTNYRCYTGKGAAKLNKVLADSKIPVFIRYYLDDKDVDPERMQVGSAMCTSGNEKGVVEKKNGQHHQFFHDDTCEVVANFFAEI